jgi:aminocarboxymuconate-semialdehyde decarboxylase
MASRRQFLRDLAGATGIVFVECGFTGAVPQTARGVKPKHRPVVLNGRRIRTVDIHAHCAVVRAIELLQAPAAAQGGNAGLLLEGQALAERIAVMDAQGIDIAVLSINPNWYSVERDLATQLISVQNESLGAFCATHSEHFAAFAAVA